MLKSDAAAYLAGVTQVEGAQASAPTNLHVITGEVGQNSEDGKTTVSVDGLVFSEEDSQEIEMDTLGGLEEGDIATIILTGEAGHGMTPLAIGAVGSVDRINAKVIETQLLLADKADIQDLTAATARIDDLEADHVTVNDFTAATGRIGDLEADNVTINGRLQAAELDIDGIQADYLKAADLQAEQARVGNLLANKADVSDLTAATGRISDLEADHVTVTDFTAATGRIDDLEADHVTVNDFTAATGRIDDLEADHVTVNDFTAATGRISDLEADHIGTSDLQAEQARVSNLLANKANVSDLTAAKGRISDLEADHVSVADFQAEQANIDTLQANTADIATIRANSAKVQNLTAAQLEADHATVGSLSTTYATIANLNAANGRITNLESTKANISDLEANYITADEIEATYMHANMSNSDVAWIENGTIKNGAIVSAMINDVSANKLTAGTINGSVINVTNLNADNITTGTINGQRIGEGSLSLSKLEDDVYTEAEVNSIVDGLNDRIDGAIETFTGTAVPTLSNSPASSWNTTKLRDEHVGDVYYVVNSQSQQNGYCYRFTKSGSTYSWQLIKDSDVTAALSRLTTAEGKITTFDSDISTLKTDTGTLTTRTTNLETRMSDAEDDILDKVDVTTFNEVSDTVDAHTQTISQHTTALSNKADNSTVTAVTNRVSKNEQDISGINTTIGELQDTVETKADGSTVSTISNKLNTVSDTVDGHTQAITSVQNTLSTKADSSTVSTLTTKVNTVSDTVDGHTQRLSSVEDTLETKADGSTVSTLQTNFATFKQQTEQFESTIKTELKTTDDKIENLEIGGRNLLFLTRDFETKSGSTTGGYLSAVSLETRIPIVSETYKGLAVRHFMTSGIDTSTYYDLTYSSLLIPISGKSYVFSFYAKGTGKVRTHFYPNNSGGTYKNTGSQGQSNISYDGYMDFNVSSDWQRFWVRFEIGGTQGTNARHALLRVFGGNDIYVCGLKFEEGTKSTDWTPAPEDVESRVTAAETSIEQNATAIALRATKTDVYQGAQPNLMPMFSMGFDDIYNATSNPDGYWNVLDSSRITQGENGWAHVSSSTSGTTRFSVNPDFGGEIKPSTTYTVLVEIKNLTSTGTVQVIVSIDGQWSQSSYFNASSYFYPENGSKYITLSSHSSFDSATTMLYGYFYLSGTSPSVECDVRISLYEGEYSGPYKPYSGKYLYATQGDYAELKVTTDGITSTVSKISGAKYVNATSAGWSLNNLKVYAAEGHSENWNVTSTDGLRVGDTVYVKGTDSTRSCTVYVKTTVVSVNTASNFTGTSHGYEDVLPVDTIKSTINQSSDSVKIQAKHVEIDGTAVFNAISSDVDTAITNKGYQTASQVSTAVTNGISASKTIPDTRNDNQPPSWYFANYPRQTVTEFKQTSVMGLSGEVYCYLTTVVPWGDKSGGYPKQTTQVVGKSYWRVGVSDSAWGDWQESETTAGAQDKIDSAIDEIEVGGRNLLAYSGTGKNWYYSTFANGVYTRSTTATSENYVEGRTVAPLELGETYTLSAWMKTNGQVSSVDMFLYDHAAKTIRSKGLGEITTEWAFYTLTVTMPDSWVGGTNTAVGWHVRFDNNGSKISGTEAILYVKEPKLERGNKPTDWTPAPEDLVTRTQRIYYRWNSATAPAAPTSWVTKGDDGSALWTKMHVSITESYKYIYTCEQYEMADGMLGHTDVLLDNSITVIDGGNIITGTVDANKLNAADINASKTLTVGAMTDAAAATILNSNVRVGGRNLFVNTGNYATWDADAPQTYITRYDDCIKFTPPSSASWWTIEPHEAYIPLSEWDTSATYTVSIDVKFDNLKSVPTYPMVALETVKNNTTVGYSARVREIGYRVVPTTNDWTHFEYAVNGDHSTWESRASGTPAYIKVLIWLYLTSSNADAVSFRNLKLEKGNKPTDWSPAPEDLLAEEQYIYISSASGTTSINKNTTWVTQSSDVQNVWTTKRPTYNSSYPVLFVAKQSKTVGGSVSCTTPVKDDTTTVIDGGHITTGTIDTNRLNADTIKSNIVQTTNLSASKITSGDISADRIKANVISAINSLTAGQINAARINASQLTIGQSQVTGLTTALDNKADSTDIPSDISELNNDSGFITSADVPTKVSELNNDSGYQTSTQVDTAITSKGYATTSQAQGYATTAQQNAEKTATNYIVADSSGIKIADANPSSATTYLHLASSFLDFIRGGVSMLKAWLDGSVAKVRVGAEQIDGTDTFNTLTDNEGIKLRRGTTVLSQFATNLIELGKNSYNATISLLNNGIEIYATDIDPDHRVHFGRITSGDSYLQFAPWSTVEGDESAYSASAKFGVKHEFTSTRGFGVDDSVNIGGDGFVGLTTALVDSDDVPLAEAGMYAATNMVAGNSEIAIIGDKVFLYDGGGNTSTYYGPFPMSDVASAIPVTLYDNASAAASATATLSETAANFKRLTIFFKDTDGNYSSTEVWSPNGKRVALSLTWINGASTQDMYQRVRWVTISGTTISTYKGSSDSKYRTGQVKLGATASVANSDYLAIVHVIGYR